MRVGFFYDYDFTLTEELQQSPIFRKFSDKLKKKYGINTIDEYFSLCSGKDKIAGWMEQFLKDAKNVFNHLTNEQMRTEFAPQVKLTEGLPSWFERIKQYASSLDIELENHVISSGAYPLVAGSKIYPSLTSVISGEFLDRGKGIYKISSVVEPFRKVEHLKTICKGGDLYKDFSIEDYHINYRNVIVFGDGITDKDGFRFTKQRGGFAIAVFEKGNKESFNESVSSLGSRIPAESSVNFILPRDYSEGSILEKKIFQTLQNMSESEKNCDMDWEYVNNWQLNHIKNKEIVEVVRKHYNSCGYCQKKNELYFKFE